MIPVLVGGATMPAENDLPPELVAELARRNALTMIDSDWRSGVARLAGWPPSRRIVDPVPERAGATAAVAAERERAERSRQRRCVRRLQLARVPLLATALALAGAAGLLIGTFMQVDFWAPPRRRHPLRQPRILLEPGADGPGRGRARLPRALLLPQRRERIAFGLSFGFATSQRPFPSDARFSAHERRRDSIEDLWVPAPSPSSAACCWSRLAVGSAAAPTEERPPRETPAGSSSAPGAPFTVPSPAGPFSGLARLQDYESLGLFIGTGDQDNYVKLVAGCRGVAFLGAVVRSRRVPLERRPSAARARDVHLFLVALRWAATLALRVVAAERHRAKSLPAGGFGRARRRRSDPRGRPGRAAEGAEGMTVMLARTPVAGLAIVSPARGIARA